MKSKFRAWIEWHFGFGADWSIKHILFIIFAIGIIIGVFLFFDSPDKTRENKLKTFNLKTTGTIYKIEPKEMIAHSYEGSRTKVLGYTFYFTFNIDNKIYTSTDYILNKKNNKKLINYLHRHIGQNTIKINYSSINPKNAMISYDNI